MRKFTPLYVNLTLLLLYCFAVYSKFSYSPLFVLVYAIFPLPTIFFIWSYISTKNLSLVVVQNSVNIFAGFFLYHYFYVEYFDTKGKDLFTEFTNIALYIFLAHVSAGIVTEIALFIKKRKLVRFPFSYIIKILLIILTYFSLFFFGMQKYSENAETIINKLKRTNPIAYLQNNAKVQIEKIKEALEVL